MAIRVYLSEVELRRAVAELAGVSDKLPQVIVRALNRSIITARKLASQEIRRDLLAPDREVKGRLNVMKATKTRQQASVTAPRGKIPLVKFPTKPRVPRPTKRRGGVYRPPVGLTVTTRRSEGPKVIPGAFLARGPKAGLQVFKRAGDGRSKLTRLYGPGVRETFGTPEVLQKISRQASATLQKRFAHEVNRLLGGH